jgi:hypothetical protein
MATKIQINADKDVRSLPFSEQVRFRLANPTPRAMSLWLGKTPVCLRMLGFPDLPLRMSAGVLAKIHTGKGGERAAIEEKFLCRLPELIDDPEAVFDSHTVAGALVVLITARADDGSGIVVVSIEANLQDANTPANMITSAYAKGRPDWVAEQIKAGRLRYCGKIKGPDTLEVSGHTLNRVTEPGSQNPSSITILLPDDLRNYRTQLRDASLKSTGINVSL